MYVRACSKDYVDFAEVCFKEFGDRVKYWTTFNEPWTYSSQGYAVGKFAPGRSSSYVSKNCFPGDSARQPYIVTHNIILAHAEAVALYGASSLLASAAAAGRDGRAMERRLGATGGASSLLASDFQRRG